MFRSTDSDSVPDSLGSVAIVKPKAGGPAFWRSLTLLLRDDVEEFKVLALQLHSRAWLYVIPLDVLKDLEHTWIPDNLGVIIAKDLDIRFYCGSLEGMWLKGRFSCKSITVRKGKERIQRWWGEAEYEYLEVIEDNKKYRVYRGYNLD